MPYAHTVAKRIFWCFQYYPRIEATTRRPRLFERSETQEYDHPFRSGKGFAVWVPPLWENPLMGRWNFRVVIGWWKKMPEYMGDSDIDELIQGAVKGIRGDINVQDIKEMKKVGL